MEEGTFQQEAHDVWECLISETTEAEGWSREARTLLLRIPQVHVRANL